MIHQAMILKGLSLVTYSQRVKGDNGTHTQRVEDDMDDSSSSGFSGFSNRANDIQNSNDTHSSSADCSRCSSVNDTDYHDPITPYQEEDEYQSPWYDSDGNEILPGHQLYYIYK